MISENYEVRFNPNLCAKVSLQKIVLAETELPKRLHMSNATNHREPETRDWGAGVPDTTM